MLVGSGGWELLEGGGAPVVLPFAIVDNFVIYDNPVRQALHNDWPEEPGVLLSATR